MLEDIRNREIKIEDIVIGERARKELGDDFDALVVSIKNRGLMYPILVNRNKEGTIDLMGGYRRLVAHTQLGLKTITARFYEDLTEVERLIFEYEENLHEPLTWDEKASIHAKVHGLMQQEYGIARRKSEGSGWTLAQTAEMLNVNEGQLSQDIKLFEAIECMPELRNLTSRRQALKTVDRIEEIAILTELARRRGDQQDFAVPYHLYCGDAVQVIKERIEDETIDLVLFDPPWGIDIHKVASARGPRGEKTSYKDDSWFSSVNLVTNLLPELFRVMKPDAHMYMFCGIQDRDFWYDLLTNYAATSDRLDKWIMLFPKAKKLLLEFGDIISKENEKRTWSFYVELVPLIWVKEGGGFTDFDTKFMPRYETFLFCSKGQKKNLNEAISNVFEVNRPISTERIHTQEKPVELYQKLIKVSTQENEFVLDPCAGSFVTSVASTLLGRRSICIDNDEVCYAKGLERMAGLIVDQEEEDDNKGVMV